MALRHWKLNLIGLIHWLAYILVITNLFLMNLNVLYGEPIYFMTNIVLCLLSVVLLTIVLYMKKGIDSTPIIGILVNVLSAVIIIGSLYFYVN
ncbi:hypothetical protein MXL46_11655 [Heyndrickxia sporothermodurans]|uniref:hypothetical protein n=1 Tax=Heyndrickxia sporothermodurans TaxID=46224 RepID=UPI002DC01E38|nr:hypothetical protein [Heyndrickxia sporothermodurans]MEB6549741.1 hypothetical protein [Heyndrickxia sporothermodurans]